MVQQNEFDLVMDYIGENIQIDTETIKCGIINLIGINSNSFGQNFTVLTGDTLGSYIRNRRRYYAAKALQREPDKSICEIALDYIGRLYYGEASVVRIKTLVPPNEENAKRLKDAIERVDQFAPDVDEQIDHILYPPHPPHIMHRRQSFAISVPSVDTAEEISETHVTSPYIKGRLQAWAYDFDSNEPFYDTFGHRWLKCANCGALKRDDEMSDYGGKWGMTKSLFRNCSRSNTQKNITW